MRKINKKKIGKVYSLVSKPQLRAGVIIGWKKCRVHNRDGSIKHVIVKLEIPACADRVDPGEDKKRAQFAKVLKIGGGKHKSAFSWFDPLFKYRTGRMVAPRFGLNRETWVVCTSGIHFFLKRKLAADYIL